MKILPMSMLAALWFATTAVAAPVTPGGDVAAGRVAFQACASCHAVYPGARGGFGPSLYGVVGRAAGSAPGYAYSGP